MKIHLLSIQLQNVQQYSLGVIRLCTLKDHIKDHQNKPEILLFVYALKGPLK